MSSKLAPLVVVGPTASGKSTLAVDLATALRAEGAAAEVISVDAKAVYRSMDVGTAKPTDAERDGIAHHLIDVADPEEEYTVSLFADAVNEVLADCADRGVTPVLAGGTGLYVRSVIDGFTIPPKFPDVAGELEAEANTDRLFGRLQKLDPEAAAKMLPTNRRRIVRALEVTLGSGQPFSSFGPGVEVYPPTRFVQAGIEIDRAVMDARIDARYDQQMDNGFLDEARALSERDLSRTASQALGYRELFAHLDGACSLEDAVSEAKARTRKFARRQQRWFRRDPRVQWFAHDDPDLTSSVRNWWGEQPVI